MEGNAAPGGLDGGFVELEWLEAVAGTTFLYPAAGSDTHDFVALLAPRITRFIFNDLHYSSRTDRIVPVPDGWRLVSREGWNLEARDDTPEPRYGSHGAYRHLSPSTLEEVFTRNGCEIRIHRRRGFGAYALREQNPASIGVFAHRRDSMGEGGSNLWFLANRPRRHGPQSHLWDQLRPRLALKALVISDGSLTRFGLLKLEAGSEPRALYEARKAVGPITAQGCVWTCVGYMPSPRMALVWGVEQLAGFPDVEG
jgi:hypothetical protein